MKGLYKRLGVKNDCSKQDIIDAYKKLAQKLHPDKTGGSVESFTKLKEAYEVLKNPDKRARYDAGESTEDITPDEIQARDILSTLLSDAIMVAKDDVDLIQQVRNSINTSLVDNQSVIRQEKEAIEKMRHVLSRIEYTGNDDRNLVKGNIDMRIGMAEDRIQDTIKRNNWGRLALKMLDDYKCKVTIQHEASYMQVKMDRADSYQQPHIKWWPGA